MKEKTKLRVIQILCIVSLLITVFSIQRTYAKYFEQVDTTYATNIKKWVINVNEKNIHEETILSNVMTPQFFYNPHMNTNRDITDTTNKDLNNILVPGREGYFEFLIDYSNVDVAFKFQFDIEQLNDTLLDDFEVYGYSIIDTELELTETTQVSDITNIQTLTKDAEGKYQLSGITQQIDPSTDVDNNGEKKRRILVLFRWYDGEDNTMDNTADTIFKGTDSTDENEIHTLLNYNVKITFTQLI